MHGWLHGPHINLEALFLFTNLGVEADWLMREKPVTIEVRKAGQHWSVFAEEQLITQTVYEKGAQTLEAVLRGLLRYTSRKLFRVAVSDALKGPKPAEPAKGRKPPKAAKVRSASAKGIKTV